MTNTFEALGLDPVLLQTLAELGYETPTPIQATAIPRLLNGEDVIGQAQTGTGKTAAFTLPMLHHFDGSYLYGMILTPTRELAIQVSEAVHRYGQAVGARVLPIYGGQPYSRQIRRLEKGVHVVVGTPGRILDLIRQNALDLSAIRYFVMDEADEMLRMSFVDDVEAILAATDKQNRQTAIFSATMPEPIQRLAQKYMNNPQVVSVASEDITVDNITQRYYVVRETDKIPALSRLLEVERLNNAVIFTRTKAGAAQLAETLVMRGYRAEAIHGDLPQAERERILRRFRNQAFTILVATDVMARGVDIPEVSHVINFDIPQLPIEYVHRIGRTGRAGRTGDAILLVTPAQRRNMKMIERYTNKTMKRGTLPSREEVLQARNVQFRDEMMAYLDGLEELSDDGLLDELRAMGYDSDTVALAAMQALRAHEAQRPLEDIREVKERDKVVEVRSPRGDKGSYERDERGQELGMVTLKVAVGRNDGVKPADLVYAIASHGDIPGRALGAIKILNYETFVDVPEQHVESILDSDRSTRIKGKPMVVEIATNPPARGRNHSDDSRNGNDRGDDQHRAKRRRYKQKSR